MGAGRPVEARIRLGVLVHDLVELVGLLGYYSLVSMTLNTFEVGLPDGEVSDLVP